MTTKNVTFWEPPFTRSCSAKGWHIEGNQYLGSGAFGDVFRACHGKDCDYVAKIIRYTPDSLSELQREKSLLYKLGQQGVSPRLQQALLCDDLKSLSKMIHHPQTYLDLVAKRKAELLEDLPHYKPSPEDYRHMKQLLESPDIAILFSNYIQGIGPSHIEELRPAVESLIDTLLSQGLIPDVNKGNLVPYREKNKKWKVKLVDVGFMSMNPTPVKLTSYERKQFVDQALKNIAKRYVIFHLPVTGQTKSK